VVVAGLGFTAAGVAAGSAGAWMMSLCGGTIASGSTVAVLQSVGAAGMGSVATTIVSAIGAVGGIVVAAIV